MINKGCFTFQRLIILSSLFLLFITPLHGQKTQITEETFIVQVESLLKGLPANKGDQLTNGVKNWWMRESNSSVKTVAVETLNKLIERNFKPQPEISGFFEALILFSGRQSSEQLLRWLKVNRYLLETETSGRYSLYVQATESMLSDSVLLKTPLATWKTNNSEFSIASDTSTGFFFTKTELTCQTRMPGNTIRATSGIFRPLNKTWAGHQGVMTWEKFNFPADSLYVTLGRYSINLQLPEFQADSCDFVHKLLQSTVKGKLVVNFRDAVRQDYPQFSSYDDNIQFEKLIPNTKYVGGIGIEGSRIVLGGDPSKTSRFEIKGKPRGRAIIRAKIYLLTPRYISAPEAAVSMIFDGDSIYHPNTIATYDIKEKVLTCSQGRSLLSQSPFTSTYHKTEITSAGLIWNMNDGSFAFRKSTGLVKEGDALIVSENNFSIGEYNKLQGYDQVNPLDQLLRITGKDAPGPYSVAWLASALNMTPEQARMFIIRIAAGGFVNYKFLNDEFVVRPKLIHYTQAKSKKSDYDEITLVSKGATTNAAIDLRKLRMRIYSTDTVVLSYSKRVVMFPSHRSVTMGKNRDMYFNGSFYGGLFHFFTSDTSTFFYEPFIVKVPQVDSLKIWVLDTTSTNLAGDPKAFRLNSVLERLSGRLFIDDPNNKSGKNQKIVGFPEFNSDTSYAYLYYNRGRFGKEYDRRKFYYTVNPFKVNNLNRIKKSELKFQGFLTTSGIFPVLRNQLVVRPDYSLGFEMQTGKQGMPTYLTENSSKGTLTGRIDLSNNGLRGDGKLVYLNSVTLTDTTNSSDTTDLVFFPEKMTGYAKSFQISPVETGIEFPSVNGKYVKQIWVPYKDRLEVVSRKYPIGLYDDAVALTGRLFFEPTGLKAQGNAVFEQSETESKYFTFKNREYRADTADFKLFTPDGKDVTLIADNYNSFFDLKNRRADFHTNKAQSVIRFPLNNYESTIPDFVWEMDKARLELTSAGYDELKKRLWSLPARDLILGDEKHLFQGPLFTATSQSADSLQFIGFGASFDILKSELSIRDVRYIRVADAALVLNDGLVSVGKKGVMKPFTNIQVATIHDSLIHVLHSANAVIKSKHQLFGNAYFHYTDGGKIDYNLKIDNLHTDTLTGITYGGSAIKDSLKFRLSEAFEFKGSVAFEANKPFLRFQGDTKLHHLSRCKLQKPVWFVFDTIVNPNEVSITLNNTTMTSEGEKLRAAIMMEADGGHFYPTFFSPVDKSQDLSVMRAIGGVGFSGSSQSYIVRSAQSLKDVDSPGTMISIDTATCNLEAKGPIDLHLQFAPEFKVGLAGKFSLTEIDSIPAMEPLIMIDCYNLPEVVDIMFNDFTQVPLPPASGGSIELQKPLADLIGSDQATLLRKTIATGQPVVSENLKNATIISGLKFVWDKEDQSFNAKGQADVLMLFGKTLNKKVPVWFQITRKRGQKEDDLKMYFEPFPGLFYYFEFGRGSSLRMSSSNLNYMTKLTDNDEAFNKKSEKNTKGKKWKAYKLSATPATDAAKFKTDIENKKL